MSVFGRVKIDEDYRRTLGSVLARCLINIRDEHLLFVSHRDTPYLTRNTLQRLANRAPEIAIEIFRGCMSTKERQSMLPSLSCIPQSSTSRLLDIDLPAVDLYGEIYENENQPNDFREIDNLAHENGKLPWDVVDLGNSPVDDIGTELLDALSICSSEEDEIPDQSDTINESFGNFTDIEYLWEFPGITGDFDDLQDLLRTYSCPHEISFPNENSAKQRISTGQLHLWFEAVYIARLAPGKWLNDACINQLARIMQRRFNTSNRCVLFTTYTLEHIYP